MKKIIVVGAGYVGLVSGVAFAYLGHQITCLDIDQERIDALKNGVSPIYEPGLESFLKKCIYNNSISFTSSYKEAFAQHPHAVILAVDTPMGENGYCDLSRIETAIKTIGAHLHNDCTIIIKSTVPVGTNTKLQHLLRETTSCTFQIDLISNPEFLREGMALHDFMHADRVIIGIRNERSEATMRTIYAPLLQASPKTKFLVMDPESSELTKYAANTMLALRISFMNWLSRLADKSYANIESIREGLGSDTRIGPAFLQAGLGFGGSCFPKDIEALKQTALDFNINSQLIDAIQEINYSQRSRFTNTVLEYLRKETSLDNASVAIWGLSFKPNTDDMRDAPSLDIIKELLDQGVSLRLFDPVAMDRAEKYITSQNWNNTHLISWCKTPLGAVDGCNALLLITEWDLFKEIDLIQLKQRLGKAAFFDGRNSFSIDEMKRHNFTYFSIGRNNDIIKNGISTLDKEDIEYCYIPKQKKRL